MSATPLEPSGVSTTAFGTTIQNLTQLERIGAHSHVRGLGIDPASLAAAAQSAAAGLVGQVPARRALAIIHNLIAAKQMANRAVLLAGPPGTGKTALALALARQLGAAVPFVVMSGSEVYSVGMSKTEVLTQAVRRACAVVIREEGEVVEGEVVEIQVDTSMAAGGGRTGKMTIKTTDMETVYDLGQKMIDALQKEKVQAGDVISIDKTTGRVTKLGRSYLRARDYDATGAETKFVACPEGELQQRKELEHVVSLHEIDVINSRSQGFLALFSGDTGEIKSEVREQINARLRAWITEQRATLTPGILFIDEVHMLDVEAFAYLSRVLEDPFAPVLVMASNRGVVRVRGGGVDETGMFGVPEDVLDRCLVVRTERYDADEMREILRQRMAEEEVKMAPDAEDELVRAVMGGDGGSGSGSLRYGMQLITVASLIATRRKREAVSLEDVQRAYGMFLDERRSVQYVRDHAQELLYGVAQMGAATTADAEMV